MHIGDRVRFLSDYRDLSFAEAYGVLVKELHLTGRAIVVVDADDQVVYVEYVKELADHPDYEAALAAARQAAGL
jgi:thiol peroxidase